MRVRRRILARGVQGDRVDRPRGTVRLRVDVDGRLATGERRRRQRELDPHGYQRYAPNTTPHHADWIVPPEIGRPALVRAAEGPCKSAPPGEV